MTVKDDILRNAQSLAPYQKTLKKKKLKKDKKGNYYIYINKKKYTFDPDTCVILK